MEKKYRCAFCGDITNDSEMANQSCTECGNNTYVELDVEEVEIPQYILDDIAAEEYVEMYDDITLPYLVENDLNSAIESLKQ